MLLPVARFAPCGLAELTSSGVITAANETLVGWLQRSPDDVIGHEIFEFVSDANATLRSALQSDQWDGTPFTLDVQLQIGTTARPLLLASSSYLVDGEVRMSVVFFDATVSTGVSDRATDDWNLSRRVSARLEVLVDTAASFGRAKTEAELAALLVEAVYQATAADDVAVYLLDDDDTYVQFAGSNPLLGRYPNEASTVVGEALRTGDPIFLASPADANAFAPGWNVDSVFRDAGIHSVIVAPVIDHDRIGAIAAFFRNPTHIDDQVLPLLGALARQAAQVIIRLRLEAEVQRAASRDIVTGLANRRRLEERSAALSEADDHLVAAFFLDLDKFKQINDERGHAVGDRLLKQVGRRISSIIRDEDAVARYGGDEFVAICPVPDEETALAIAERVREAIAQPYDGDIADVPVRASIGVAIAQAPTSIEQLIRAADLAMYSAKTSGGNTVVRSAA